MKKVKKIKMNKFYIVKDLHSDRILKGFVVLKRKRGICEGYTIDTITGEIKFESFVVLYDISLKGELDAMNTFYKSKNQFCVAHADCYFYKKSTIVYSKMFFTTLAFLLIFMYICLWLDGFIN